VETCETCGKEITDPREVAYPHGHHGEDVQCLGCYTSGADAIYEESQDRRGIDGNLK